MTDSQDTKNHEVGLFDELIEKHEGLAVELAQPLGPVDQASLARVWARIKAGIAA